MHPIQHTQNPVFRPANDRATRYRPNRTHTLKYSKQISFPFHTNRYIRKDRCFCYATEKNGKVRKTIRARTETATRVQAALQPTATKWC